jgi:hypothetical protein
VVAAVLAVVAGGCGGSGSRAGGPTAYPTPTTAAGTTSAPPTTQSPIDGVQSFSVQAGHTDAPVSYPQVPPVGGVHNPVWQPCAFYDQPVPNEKGVHSLEHGAIWITYRPDLPPAEVDVVASLARSRKDVLASRWDDGLPAPLVATAWGRQLQLPSATDPRLSEFVRLYANKGPETNAPC